MISEGIKDIPLAELEVGRNARTSRISLGEDDLIASMEVVGQIHPIIAYYNSEKKCYLILAGQRRFNAFQQLDKKHPGAGFDKIKCNVIRKPKSEEDELAISVAENLTQIPMHDFDSMRAVTKLYDKYNDYKMVQEAFGITKNTVDKFVRLARLPDSLKVAVQNGEISNAPKIAETAALQAVDSLKYVKGGDVPESDVLEFAKIYAKGEVDKTALKKEAAKGHRSIQDIVDAAKITPSTREIIKFPLEVAEKLKEVAESKGESSNSRATWYVVNGVTRDFEDIGE